MKVGSKLDIFGQSTFVFCFPTFQVESMCTGFHKGKL